MHRTPRPVGALLLCLGLSLLPALAVAATEPAVFASSWREPTPTGEAASHVRRWLGGTAWEIVTPPEGLPGTIWDMEWIDGALWVALEDFNGGGGVYRWEGSTWTNLWIPPCPDCTAISTIHAVGPEIYATDIMSGIYRWNGGTSWTQVASIPNIERSIASSVHDGRPMLYLGDGSTDTLWFHDPDGIVPCTSLCPPPSGDACAAGCFTGSCIHSFSDHDDGRRYGLTVFAGAYGGLLYVWNRIVAGFATYGIVGDSNINALADFHGRLHVGNSQGQVYSFVDVFVAPLERDFTASEPVSTMTVDADRDLLWVGFGGVPFLESINTGTSSIRTFTGTAWVDRSLPNAFGAGVTDIVLAPDAPPPDNPIVACDAGFAQAFECRRPVNEVMLDATGTVLVAGLDPDSVTYTWTGDFLPGTATGQVPIVHVVGLGDHLIQLTVSVAGFEATCSVVMSIFDSVAPTFDPPPPDVSIRCDEPVPGLPTVRAFDSCDGDVTVALAEVREDGACRDSYRLVRTWTARDASGNVATERQTVNVRDDVAPTLAGVPPDDTAGCTRVPPAPAAVTATDNCDPAPRVDIAETRVDGPCAGSFAIDRTWTATDRCGNAATAHQHLAASDRTAPILAGVPGDVSAGCGHVPAAPAVTASDDCDPAPRVTFTETRTDGACAGSFSLARTWTAIDACGNAASGRQVVSVTDATPPVLAGVPADDRSSCTGVPPAPAVATATDDCDPAPRVTFAETRVDGACVGSFTIERTWTATDACGNVVSARQRLSASDDVAPVLGGVPADVAVDCAHVPSAAVVTAADTCDPAPRVAFSETRTDGACPGSFTLTRSWTATDACGNAASARQLVSVSDVRAPVLAGVPGDATVDCTHVPTAPAVTATDDCDGAPRVAFTETRTDGTCAGSFSLTRTWTATDACGNAASARQRVDVRDVLPPVLAGVPGDATVDCTHVPTAPVVTATDDCDAAPRVAFTETRADGACAGSFTLTRSWTATDACGNAASARQVVRVVDSTAPVVAPSRERIACLWPPDHRMRVLAASELSPVIGADCSGPVTWRLAGCASDQPDDDRGDGATSPDCVVAADGRSVQVRAERSGRGTSGRTYSLSIVAIDACGNASAPTVVGVVTVPQDRDPAGRCR